MTLDADIAAADALGLARINAQENRDRNKAAIGGVQYFEREAADLMTQRQELRAHLVYSLGPNYMKPTTATTDASIDADVALDVKKLSKAVIALEDFILAAGPDGKPLGV